ncbi:polysaccharide deacetylase [Clostridiales bacterium oral taxon 876 str. F0540]|nr:polysaccharide deacetylase [Clostridiales bacterium oral taxon 876 str. F0540]
MVKTSKKFAQWQDFLKLLMYNESIINSGDGTLYNIKLEKTKKHRKHKILAVAAVFSLVLLVIIPVAYSSFKKAHDKRNIVISTSAPINNGQAGKNMEDMKISDSKESGVPANGIDKQLSGISDEKGAKEAFLTFDDGPTRGVTPEILDVLKKYDVKATFFVIGKMVDLNKDILIREKNEGHAIANHSYSHDYKHLYSDPKNFVEDINKADNEIKNVLDEYNLKLIRFPGGSFGAQREPYRKAIIDAGYHFIDWNALNGDAEGKPKSPEQLVEEVKKTAKHPNHLVVLMHDAPNKQTTIQALPQIIEYLKSKGYTFKTLD